MHENLRKTYVFNMFYGVVVAWMDAFCHHFDILEDVLSSWRSFGLAILILWRLWGSMLGVLLTFGVFFGPPPHHGTRQGNRIWGPRGGVRGGVLSAVCWKSGDLVNA